MGRNAKLRAERKLNAAPKVPYTVAGRVQLTFNLIEWEALMEFQRQMNVQGEKVLSVEQLCRQAVFLTLQQAYAQAHKLEQKLAAEAQGVSDGQSTSRIIATDNASAPTSEDAATDLLAESQADTAEATSASGN